MKKTGLVDDVVIKYDGQEALNYLQQENNPPDVIFLDLNMPTLDGWEFLDVYKDIRSRNLESTKIAILTSSANPEDMELLNQFEYVIDFVSKPLSEKRIKEIISKLEP
jgi:CheY-like chemotaxis protein